MKFAKKSIIGTVLAIICLSLSVSGNTQQTEQEAADKLAEMVYQSMTSGFAPLQGESLKNVLPYGEYVFPGKCFSPDDGNNIKVEHKLLVIFHLASGRITTNYRTTNTDHSGNDYQYHYVSAEGERTHYKLTERRGIHFVLSKNSSPVTEYCQFTLVKVRDSVSI